MAGTRGWRLVYLWLKGYFNPKITFLELEPWEETVTDIRCDKCGSAHFIEGPSGGMSTNYICANPDCRARYNVSPFGKEFVGYDNTEEENQRIADNAELHRNRRRGVYYAKGWDLFEKGGKMLDIAHEKIDYDDQANLTCKLEELRNYMLAGFIDAFTHTVREKLNGQKSPQEVSQGESQVKREVDESLRYSG